LGLRVEITRISIGSLCQQPRRLGSISVQYSLNQRLAQAILSVFSVFPVGKPAAGNKQQKNQV